jgi:hypothetical protein
MKHKDKKENETNKIQDIERPFPSKNQNTERTEKEAFHKKRKGSIQKRKSKSTQR